MITSNELATDILRELGISTKRVTRVNLQLEAGKPAILWVASYLPHDFCIAEALDKYNLVAEPVVGNQGVSDDV